MADNLREWALGVRADLGELVDAYQSELDSVAAQRDSARVANRLATRCYGCQTPEGDPFKLMMGLCYRHAAHVETMLRSMEGRAQRAETRRDQLEDDLATGRAAAKLSGFATMPSPCRYAFTWQEGAGEGGGRVSCQLTGGHPGPHRYRQGSFYACWPADDTFSDEEPF